MHSYTLSRDMRDGLQAETVIPLGVDNRELRILTHKGSRGLMCSAQAVQSTGKDGCYTFVLFRDYSKNLAHNPTARATESNVRAMHEAALAEIEPIVAAALAMYVAPKVPA